MTVNAAYRCTHGIVRTLVTMGILGILTNCSIDIKHNYTNIALQFGKLTCLPKYSAQTFLF